MKGVSRQDLRILVNGFWMIPVLEIGEMRRDLAYFGVMGRVSQIILFSIVLC